MSESITYKQNHVNFSWMHACTVMRCKNDMWNNISWSCDENDDDI